MKFSIKVSSEEIRKINRKASREIEIDNGMNYNRHRVHKSLKTYGKKDRQYKIDW